MLSIVIAFLLVPYAIIICASCLCVRRQWHTKSPFWGANKQGVSVVVCVHKESLSTVVSCLNSIKKALSETDEIVVVADRASEDVCHYLAENYLYAQTSNGLFGKKNAQRKGVDLARNELILCTDADCQMLPDCINAVRKVAMSKDDEVVLLPIRMYGTPDTFGRLVEMEFACLQMTGLGTAMLGLPTMVNGAGMAFSKSLYLRHNSKADTYASGDDMFLLEHAIKSKSTISVCACSDAVIQTSAPTTLHGYLRQRIRWFGKAGGYSTVAVKLLAVAVFSANVSWTLALLIGSWTLGTALFLCKSIVDGYACFSGKRTLQTHAILSDILLLEMLYPLMILIVVCGAVVSDKKKW